MRPSVNTKDMAAVAAEAQQTYAVISPQSDAGFVARAFGWAKQCFTGAYADYQAVDARYHDFEHTLQGTLCMVRLLRGRHRAGAQPLITPRLFELGLMAILLHDTGYLKRRDDSSGSGAKYTIVHVGRSAEFAEQFLKEQGFGPGEITAVQNMIHCTGVDAALSVIPFQSETEKITGFALGTADLLGQMAAEDYVDKLPILYAEFAEAIRYTKDRTHFIAAFSSASDLMRKTPTFWEKYVLRKLDRDFGGLYKFLNDPFPDGPNEYLERISANMDRLKQQFFAVGATRVAN